MSYWCFVLTLSCVSLFPDLAETNWQFSEFNRSDANPILGPCASTLFYCPVRNKEIHWEEKHVFNPAAIVRDGKVYLIYRAEDDSGERVGTYTSRLGLAESEDGIHFQRREYPVLSPDMDNQSTYEFPGGCEDPRIIETEEGLYIMTYTQWNRKIAALAIATSTDLIYWRKWGYAFKDDVHLGRRWSKSGSIIVRREGDRLIATKIQGKYWMYWGDGTIYAATSEDLITWQPVVDEHFQLVSVLSPREGQFDSRLVEAGPPALLTEHGIVLIYNGQNARTGGDSNLLGMTYSVGQVLFDVNDPINVLARSDQYFLKPEYPYEKKGQYRWGAIFAEGLVHFHDQWFLYYGSADTKIGVAISQDEH